jgi:DNA invertase Pin-like site-specific DNA recombinase
MKKAAIYARVSTPDQYLEALLSAPVQKSP